MSACAPITDNRRLAPETPHDLTKLPATTAGQTNFSLFSNPRHQATSLATCFYPVLLRAHVNWGTNRIFCATTTRAALPFTNQRAGVYPTPFGIRKKISTESRYCPF